MNALLKECATEGGLQTALHDFQLKSRLSTEQKDKLNRRLIAPETLERAVSPPITPDEPIRTHVELATALQLLSKWWGRTQLDQASEHRRRLYPQDPPNLNLKRDPDTGRIDRPSWFMLLALGSFQGMGHAREHQHRGFVLHCQQQRWWQVFTDTDPIEHPEKWMNIIEEYAEAQHDDEEWMQWLGQFPKLYRLRRWLDDYADLFLSIDRTREPFEMDEVLTPRSNRIHQGGGIDAPPLNRTLKIGVHFVVRELLHHGVIENRFAMPHAYAPISSVKVFFKAFRACVSSSKDIHSILIEHLGEDGATFNGDYDIPLRIISSDVSLRDSLLTGRAQ